MPTVTNVLEFVGKYSVAETSQAKAINLVFHYRLLTGALDNRTALLNAISAQITNYLILNWMTTDVTHVEDDVRLLDDATEQYSVSSSGVTGSIALPRLPATLACVFPIQCATRGRNFRGSKHLSPVPTAYALKDELSAAGITAANNVKTQLAGIMTSANGSTYIPFVLSRSLSQLRTNPTTIVGSDRLNVLVNKTLGTMRGRKEKTVR